MKTYEQMQERAHDVALRIAGERRNTLLLGPPGTSKPMIALRVPSLLGRLEPDHAREIVFSFYAAGLGDRVDKMWPTIERPLRAPHHTVSEAGMRGQIREYLPARRPGEIQLAEHGVLFLDELPEFRRDAIDAVRAGIADRDILVIASALPCPCGWNGSSVRECRCTSDAVFRYKARLADHSRGFGFWIEVVS
jgi:magnesium chelatase family protein